MPRGESPWPGSLSQFSLAFPQGGHAFFAWREKFSIRGDFCLALAALCRWLRPHVSVMLFAILLLMRSSRCFRLIRGSPSPLLMPRYFGSHLHLLSLYFATKMHAEQFRAIIANLPLHQLCKYLCEKAQEDGSEVYGTLLWVPEEGRLALLDCLTASLESPPLTPRSAAGGDTAADAAGSSSPLQADAAGGSSTLPAASGSSSTLPSAGPASSADPGTLPHFGKDAADPPLRDPWTLRRILCCRRGATLALHTCAVTTTTWASPMTTGTITGSAMAGGSL